MLTTVDLYDHLGVQTGKIREVWSDRMLPAKPATFEPPPAQEMPHAALCIRWCVPQFASKVAPLMSSS
jgi:hypothetical protein